MTSAVWIAGGLLFRVLDERNPASVPSDGWPGVTLLIPAHNEEQVIAGCVAAARAVDYPLLEVLVLDDGSSDATVAVATTAAEGDDRDPWSSAIRSIAGKPTGSTWASHAQSTTSSPSPTQTHTCIRWR